MDEQRKRDDERPDEHQPGSDEHQPGSQDRVREPMMEAPVAPAGSWHGVARERSWNPAQGDRSFGYGADETIAPEPVDDASEAGTGSGRRAEPGRPMTRPRDAEAPGE